jgi:hypothetical protein
MQIWHFINDLSERGIELNISLGGGLGADWPAFQRSSASPVNARKPQWALILTHDVSSTNQPYKSEEPTVTTTLNAL